MAHKALYGGTVYKKKGGTELINGTVYKKAYSNNLIGGTVYELGFASWPDDLSTGLEFISASPFAISVSYPEWDGTLEYCNGEGSWKTWDGSEISSGKTKSGQCIYIRGRGNTKVTGEGDSFIKWTLSGTDIKCNGNIERLLDYATVEVGEHPAMAEYCYAHIFEDCTALTKAPSLPAVTLTDSCYLNMFCGCTSLINAPSLPAVTLTDSCYLNMFCGCTSLINAPSLPATTLAESCYYRMFLNCTALTDAPSLPATTLAEYCYTGMFGNCAALINAPSLPATTLAELCYFGMFMKCTALTAVPRLPATTLTNNCYMSMFSGCTKIKLSDTQTGTYTKAYRIPHSGTGTTATLALMTMFSSTGGTFTGTPEINTTYYLDSSNTIV